MIEVAPELEGESGYPIGQSRMWLLVKVTSFCYNALSTMATSSGIARNRRMPMQWIWTDRCGKTAAEYLEESGTVLDGDEEQDITELIQAEQDVMVIHYKAKQRIAEIRKLRQYFKRPDPEERRRLLAEKMKTSPCHRCGELGHSLRRR